MLYIVLIPFWVWGDRFYLIFQQSNLKSKHGYLCMYVSVFTKPSHQSDLPPITTHNNFHYFPLLLSKLVLYGMAMDVRSRTLIKIWLQVHPTRGRDVIIIRHRRNCNLVLTFIALRHVCKLRSLSKGFDRFRKVLFKLTV